jgi:hypothetical protein
MIVKISRLRKFSTTFVIKSAARARSADVLGWEQNNSH